MPLRRSPRSRPRHSAAHDDDKYAGRHRPESLSVTDSGWDPAHIPARHRAPLLGLEGRQRWVAASLLCCLGVGTAWTLSVGAQPHRVDDGGYAADITARETTTDEAASRSANRAANPTTTTPGATRTGATTPAKPPATTPTKERTNAATTTPAPTTTAAKPTRPSPVAGLTQAQMDNAAIIVKVGLNLDLPKEALVVAIACVMQESNLYNLASYAVPESLNYPHQGTGADHDSVGLFQQRSSMGWGTVEQLMTPTYSATAFYKALNQVVGWQDMSVAAAAQAVQISAFPDAYAKHETRARTIVDALV